MPVHPQVQQLLEQIDALDMPSLWELPIATARSSMRLMAQMMGPGEPVEELSDTTIPGPAGPIPIRTYRPSTDDGLPVLVFYHGGGFVLGDLDTHDRECRALANRAECAVISVEYRLAPEAKFPAAVDDAWAAVEWVAANGAAHGFDPTRVAVGGDSAGGNLAAGAAIHARDIGLELAFQLLIYPGVDAPGDHHASRAENAEGFLLDQDAIDYFIEMYVPDGDIEELVKDWRLAPLMAPSLAAVAPALVLTAEYDPLRDEGQAYADALVAAGVEARAIRYDGMIHGFFNMSGLLEDANRAIDDSAAALRAAFGVS